MYRQKRLHSCCGLGKTPMVNKSELVINPVRLARRIVVIRLTKMELLTEDVTGFLTSFHPTGQSGKSEYLRGLLKVICMEHGKPYKPHTWRVFQGMVSQT